MTDHATPNLPSRDFQATAAFYAALGFEECWRDREWMILVRGGLTLEFFSHPSLEPSANWFSCCLRVDELDAFYAQCRAAGVPEKFEGCPRRHAPAIMESKIRMGALIDLDGSLLRLIQN